jgi:uncharacterized membrane protein YhhN
VGVFAVPPSIALPYTFLAAVSVAMSFTEPFTGIGILRALPTVLLALAAFPHTRVRFGLAVAAAVALGAAGDFFLASGSRAGFIPGLVAFLLGHFFYLWAFSRELRPTRGRVALLTLATAGVLVLIALTLLKMVRANELAHIAPVLLYAAVLAATMAVCLFHQSPTRWIAAGGVIFVISDAHIAVNHILLDAPLLPITFSGYSTYYLAQFLLVHGAARETSQNTAL